MKTGLNAIVLLTLFLGTILSNGFCWTTENSFTDPPGDNPDSDNTDFVKVWVDNNATYLMFKTELNNPFNFSASSNRIYAFISVNASTGITWGFTDFLFDYVVEYTPLTTGVTQVHLEDINVPSNCLFNGESVGMGYAILSNNNKTIEFGWILNTGSGGKGYLNLSIGQEIQIKLRGGPDSDYAPDIGISPFNYTIHEPETTNGGIPGFELTYLGVILIAAITLSLIKKKTSQI